MNIPGTARITAMVGHPLSGRTVITVESCAAFCIAITIPLTYTTTSTHSVNTVAVLAAAAAIIDHGSWWWHVTIIPSMSPRAGAARNHFMCVALVTYVSPKAIVIIITISIALATAVA
jgi:hypothetical protein